MNIELALDAHATIGESPTWVAEQSALYWVDIKEPALHRFDVETHQDRSWPVSSDIGAFALMPDGGALVALRHGLHRLDLSSGALELLVPPPFDPELFRFNEGACDATGRFWVGVMFDPLRGSPERRTDSLYSFTVDGGLHREADRAELHNGMAWSGDGRRLFLSHSHAGTIFAFDFDPDEGSLGRPQPFARVAKDLGVPDGAAVDAEGGYWCAIHGGGRLLRFDAQGNVDRDIALPVSQPTMCAFAGDAMDTLYVTSASDGLDDAQRRAEPWAGGLLRMKPGAVGIKRRAWTKLGEAA